MEGKEKERGLSPYWYGLFGEPKGERTIDLLEHFPTIDGTQDDVRYWMISWAKARKVEGKWLKKTIKDCMLTGKDLYTSKWLDLANHIIHLISPKTILHDYIFDLLS
ncbi:hypothetical protein G7Y89_g7394 [Cudoniella acicularis]|uniref:Uncharacterized protein n=1 Tax=Cudoniella acicularis TaxID=354080 RepID=A0A8H4RLA2_9HELO|nr:hypothetical protein G7Y89_g7394 [Cudoniella acicularis]